MAMEALRIAAKESKFMKFILGGFIFLAVGGLVFTDINGYFRGGLPNTTVARVGETEIHIAEFDRGLRGFLQKSGLKMAQAYDAGLVNAYLNARIDNVLALQEAQELDIVVGNDILTKQLRSVFPGASKDEIESNLRARGMNEAQMSQILAQGVQTDVIARVPSVLKNYKSKTLDSVLARYDREQRSGSTYTFPTSKLSDSIEVSDSDIENHYEGVKASRYTIPETRVFTIGTLTADELKKTLPSITDADVRADYDSRIADFIVPEKRSLAQAVVNDPDQAQKIYEAASKGTSLSKALKDVTGDDTGFRDVAPYEKKGLPLELATPSFSDDVKVGSVLPPIKTILGWHVVKVTKITPELQKTFADVKADLKDELSNTRVFDALYEKITETEDLLDTGSDFADIQSKTSLKSTDTKAFSKGDTSKFPEALTQALEVSESVLDEIFNLPIGGASYPIETGEDEYIVIGVKDVNESGFTSLKDVRDGIEKTLKMERINAQAQQNVKALEDELNSGTSSIKNIVKKYGAKKTAFKNKDRNQGNAFIFKTSKDTFSAKVVGNKVTIATVSDVNFKTETAKDEGEKPSSLSNIVDSLKRQFQRQKVEISINDDLLKAQYRPDNS